MSATILHVHMVNSAMKNPSKYGSLLFPCQSMILQAAPNRFSSKISGLDFMFITRWILISSISRCSSKPLQANTRSLFLGIYPISDFFHRNRGKHRRLCGAFTFLLSDLTSNRFICYSSGQFWSCHPRNRKEWEPVINDWQGTLPTGAWG